MVVPGFRTVAASLTNRPEVVSLTNRPEIADRCTRFEVVRVDLLVVVFLAISVSASGLEGFVELMFSSLHAVDHEVTLLCVEHNQLQQRGVRSKSEYPCPRWVIIDHI